MNEQTSPVAGGATEITAHADAALRAVRIVLGVLSCCVLVAYRPLSGSWSWFGFLFAPVVIAITVGLLNTMSLKLAGRRGWRGLSQLLDVAAIVALTVALADPLGHFSWVLLVVPVVSAAVRFGSSAALLSWAVGCAGFVALSLTGAAWSSDDATLLVRIPGTLLAVAVTVGLLARWMREGWEIQNELTEIVATKEHRLAVLEHSGRALKDLPTREALELCAAQALELGFDAATVENSDGSVMHSVGDLELVAQVDRTGTRPAPGATVTVWVEDETVRSHSVSVYEAQTRSVLTGWASAPIDEDLAQVFSTLVAHASTAIETTSLLVRLRHSANHDGLTGLANRRSLDQQLSRRCGGSGRLGLAFIDMDDFKQINDQFGHAIGDEALITVARRLESVLGTYGLAARYGGDEFVILIPNADIDVMKRFARAVLRATAQPVALSGARVKVGLSLGVASATAPLSAERLLEAADRAVYEAKQAGKGSIFAVDLDRQALADDAAGSPERSSSGGRSTPQGTDHSAARRSS